jgi:hypothetical protein
MMPERVVMSTLDTGLTDFIRTASKRVSQRQ